MKNNILNILRLAKILLSEIKYISEEDANRQWEQYQKDHPNRRELHTREKFLKSTSQKIREKESQGKNIGNVSDELKDRLEVHFEMDKKYLDLAKDPEKNKEELEKMVKSRAEESGYDSPTLYRGDRPGKTKFTGKEDPSVYIQGNIFLFDDPTLAKFYTSERTNYYRSVSSMGTKDGLYSFYANLGNKKMTVDAKDSDWSDIPPPRQIGGKSKYPYGIQIDDLAVLAKDSGKTSLIVKNVFDQSGFGTQYIVFESNQLKSADPVVYDDQGKIIPLSHRFNNKSDDIRY